MTLVELGRFDRIAAHIVVGRLASEGIAAIAFDGESSVGDGSWLVVPVRVMVDEDDAAASRALLDAAPAPDWPVEPD
ncbi:putative signal transducing protein [Sphingomonas bacterium]|uniref:putative signal transducing protein n=1 Tax=Sphingomonas bacterium TaxID=1895847 RepID=UPI0015753BB6|nr:DUF2007 domain-containing protein [Sphingomonas bacterium]